MTVWECLRPVLKKYGDRKAFANSGITYSQLEKICGYFDSACDYVFCGGKTKEEQALNILRALASNKTAVPINGDNKCELYDYEKILKNYSENYSDVAFIMFTSGSTGKPKGVMLTHKNILSNIKYISSYFDLTEMRNICIIRPLIHISAITGELLYALFNGLTVHFYEKPFMPNLLSTFIYQNQIDVICTTPSVCIMLARVYKNDNFVKKCALSGEILTAKTASVLKNRFPKTEFYNVYGLTEHSPRVSALCPMEFLLKPGSVGKPIGKVKVKIVEGELLVKSDSIMRGYLGNKKLTRKKIRRGWLYTGDAAVKDNDGYLYITGRKDNMIIRAGINIFPEMIEEKVKDIVGVTDCVIKSLRNDKQITEVILQYTGNIGSIDLRRQLLIKLDKHFMPDKIEKVLKIEQTESGKKKRYER